jgi:hypothetical protein
MGRKSTYKGLEQRIEEMDKEAIELKRAAAALGQSDERYRTVFDLRDG